MGICFATAFVQEEGDQSDASEAVLRVVVVDRGTEGTKAVAPLRPDARRRAALLTDDLILSSLII